MNPRPPATFARLCRRARASALSCPLGRVQLSPSAPGVAAIVGPMASTQSPSPLAGAKSSFDWRSVARRRLPGPSDPRARPVESPNPAGPGAMPSRPFRAALACFVPVQSGRWRWSVWFRYASLRSLPAAFPRPFPTSRRRAGPTEAGAEANRASPLVTSGIPTTFARAPAVPIPCYPTLDRTEHLKSQIS